MSKIDLVLTLLMAGLTLLGFMSGLIRSLTRLIAGFVAIMAAYALTGPLGDSLSASFPAAGAVVRPIVAGLLFVICLFACLVLGNVLHKITEDNNFGIIDRLFGAVFGLTKALALSWVVLSVINMFPSQGYFGTVKSDSRYFKLYAEKGYDKWLHGFNSSKKTEEIEPAKAEP